MVNTVHGSLESLEASQRVRGWRGRSEFGLGETVSYVKLFYKT